jgi:hypothetical protein
VTLRVWWTLGFQLETSDVIFLAPPAPATIHPLIAAAIQATNQRVQRPKRHPASRFAAMPFLGHMEVRKAAMTRGA